MTKNILICVDGWSCVNFEGDDEEKFDVVLKEAGITLKEDKESIQRWIDISHSFWVYGIDAEVIEGTIPDDIDMDTLKTNLRAALGPGLRPIIFMYTDKGELA